MKSPPILGFELNTKPQCVFSGLLHHSVCYQTLTSCIFLNIVEACTIVDTRQPKKSDLYVSCKSFLFINHPPLCVCVPKCVCVSEYIIYLVSARRMESYMN
jgi:hypothetical protein